MLTPRQKQILETITSLVQKRGYTPSYEEIGAACGLTSLSSIHKHLYCLQAKGFLSLKPRTSRSLVVLKTDLRKAKVKR